MGLKGRLGPATLAPRRRRLATCRWTSSPAGSADLSRIDLAGTRPASFHRTNADPQTAAETVGQVFLGVRLQCARCHNHPFDVWTQDDYYGLSAYFTNVKPPRAEQRNAATTSTSTRSTATCSSTLSGRPGIDPAPIRACKLPPKPPGGPAPDLKGDPDALDDLADWLTRDNPQFTRNLANRVWFHLMGRGVVDPVDDFRDSNPPSNPELLDALTAASSSAGGCVCKPLVARIMKSRAYQLRLHAQRVQRRRRIQFLPRLRPPLAGRGPASTPSAAALGIIPRRMPVHASIHPRRPVARREDGRRLPQDAFGKPERLLTCECERSESTTLAQAFQLINGPDRPQARSPPSPTASAA